MGIYSAILISEPPLSKGEGKHRITEWLLSRILFLLPCHTFIMNVFKSSSG